MLSLTYLWHDYCDKYNLISRIAPPQNRLIFALDMLLCIGFRLTQPSEYCDFGFDIIPRKRRKDYHNAPKRKYAYKHLTAHSSRSITMNKFYFASVMKPFFGRKFLDTQAMTPKEFLQFFNAEEKFIYKPLTGSRACNQIIYRQDSTHSAEDLFQEIKSLPHGILEGWIHQHDALNTLYPHAVHVARIHTIHDGSAKDILVYGTYLAVASSGELANASLSSTLAILIDTDTGELITDGCDLEFNLHPKMPGTDIAFKGYQLPDWDKVLDLVRRAAAYIPDIQLVGWDVAFTPDGPILVEGNSIPDQADIQSRCWVKEGLTGGVWPIISPYVKQNIKKHR